MYNNNNITTTERNIHNGEIKTTHTPLIVKDRSETNETWKSNSENNQYKFNKKNTNFQAIIIIIIIIY